VHIGGDEVMAYGFQSMPSCMRHNLTVDQLKQHFIGNVIRQAARLGVDVQVEMCRVITCLRTPGNVGEFVRGQGNILSGKTVYCELHAWGFSALTLLVGRRKGIRPVKNLSGGVLAWLSVWSEMQTCIWPS